MALLEKYDLIVLGGGSAGIVAGVVAAGLGAKTLVIEKARLGGECSWTGCVPSKALLHAASVVKGMRTGGDIGLPGAAISREQAACTLAYVRESVERVRVADDSAGLLAEMGAEVVFGNAAFTGPDTLEFEGKALRSRRFLLATGSHPRVPDILGLQEAGFRTNQTLFDLEAVPESLVVIGGGPIGVEMAQAFARLGSQVTLLQSGPRLLPRDDGALVEMLTEILREEGIEVRLNAMVERVEVREGRKPLLVSKGQWVSGETPTFEVVADEILVATGRAPNVEGLALEKAGVRVETAGVPVDARLKTSGWCVWACGDVIGKYQFSHIAEYEAKIAVQNALLPFSQKAKFRLVPWATFTDPELASVGLTEEEAQKQGIHYEVYTHPFARDDRALVEQSGQGMVKILTAGLSGKIIGAHILGPRAGELIHEFVLAMQRGLTARHIADMIHVYPTLNIANQRAAQRWYQKQAERPLAKWLLKFNARFWR